MNRHEATAEALRELAGAHMEIASHASSSSRDALALAALHQSNRFGAFEHYAFLAKAEGKTAELHRDLARFAAHCADKTEMLAKMERWGGRR